MNSSENFTGILCLTDPVIAAFHVGRDLGQRVWLVGGTVRDLLVRSAVGLDYDFVVDGKASIFAKAHASRVGGSSFTLDEERDASRVVSKKGFQADFSSIKGTIDDDLRLRDFTINSMAILLDSLFEPVFGGKPREKSIILDPLGGLRDIENRVLRTSSSHSIEDDPVRIMRAFRLSSLLDFSMSEELVEQIKRDRSLLDAVSAERVRAELFMILDKSGSYKALSDMDGAGVLEILFPEIAEWKGFFQGGWHSYDLFGHSMKSLEAIEMVLGNTSTYFPKYADQIAARLDEELEACVSRRGVLKLASLLHDSGKLYTRIMEGGRGRFFGHEKAGEEVGRRAAGRLKLSRRSSMMLCGLTLNHMRVLALSQLERITGRARLRFFRDADGYGPELLLLSLADSMATPVDADRLDEMADLMQSLADYYFEEFVAIKPEPLITGEDIIREFGIPEGRKVGELLDALRQAEFLGEVSNRMEALEYLKGRM